MSGRRLAGSAGAIALLISSAPFLSAKPPTLTGLFPPGAARGQSLTVTMSGTFDHWPTSCWVDGDGLSVKAGEKRGELAVQVADDARPGVRWVRVHDEEGSSALRPFLIGTLPEVIESEPNDDPRRPQAIDPARATVNGRLAKRGDVDGYSVHLERGRTLTADLEAGRRLGSPMDAVLQVVSAKGFVLAQNNDAVGDDPRIVFEAPETASYIVRVFAFPSKPDSTIRFAGGNDYVYRLTLTTDGFIDHAFPLAFSDEHPTPIEAIGPNISESDAVLDVPSEGGERVLLSHPSMAGSAEARRVEGPVAVEVEPNGADRAQELADLCSVSGRIDPPGDVDIYRIALTKGDKRVFRVESRVFGLPLDAVLQILGADGKLVAEVDDAGGSSDPQLPYTPSSNGEYRVVVRDLNRRGGPHHAYLLRVIAAAPDLALSLAADKFGVTPGKEAKIVVAIDRRNGYSEPIEVTAEDLPEGVTATTALSRRSGDTAKSVTIELRSAPGAHSGPFRIVARSADRRGRRRNALAKITGFEAETDRPWLTILPGPTPKSP